MPNNRIFSINGPIVKVKNTKEFSMMEMVYVGEKKIIGEVIGVNDLETTIQVYETTSGLKPNEPVYSAKMPLFATLGPGIIANVFDGILRPLKEMEKIDGSFISVGTNINSLDLKREYDVEILVKPGDEIKSGQIYAKCEETSSIIHKCMLSPFIESGVVVNIAENGKYSVLDTIVEIKSKDGNKTS